MADSYFKVVIRDPKWDIRSEAKRLGFLYQLFIDSKKPTEVFIKYKSAKDAAKARSILAENEHVVRVESMDEWNIRPKKTAEGKEPETNGASAIPVAGTSNTAQVRSSPARTNSSAQQNTPLSMQLPMQLQIQMPMGPSGMFNVCATCRNSGASYQCFVCGIFYCGEQCQRADWPNHIVQCMPRLVRVSNPFAVNLPQLNMPQPFNGMFGGTSSNWHDNRDLAQHREPHSSNASTVGGTKPKPAKEPKATGGPSPKTTPPCNVPTNVLKSMAMKRHQDPAGPSTEVDHDAPKTAPAQPAKEAGSKLVKRVQQKTAPKRTIQYIAFPLEGENVKICHVSDKQLYVYRTGPEANGQPNRYLDFVKRSIECARTVKEFAKAPPKLEEVVFAPFDGEYYRAVVKSVEGESLVSVLFPDFGNTQTVEWKQLKDIPDKDIQYGPCYTHAVSLEGTATYTPMVRAFLSELQEQDDFEVTKVEERPDGKTVDMRHVLELYQLSDKVREVAKKEKLAQEAKGAAVAKEADQAAKIPDPATYVPVTASDIIEHDMQMGPEVELMIVEASELTDSNQLTVIQKSDSMAFANMLNECERLGSADPNPYEPDSENDVFLLFFEGIWCRALLTSQSDEKHYYLLDLGIIRTLDEKPACRRYPTGLTRKMFACECIVDNPEMLGSFRQNNNNAELRGRLLLAKVYQNTDEETEPTHIKIISMSG